MKVLVVMLAGAARSRGRATYWSSAALVALMAMTGVVAAPAPVLVRAATQTPVAPGTGLLYLGGYPAHIYIVDEAQGTVTGSIPLASGIPRDITLSTDKRHFHVLAANFESIEIADIASRKSLATYRLSEGATRRRIMGYAIDPRERYAVMLVKAATKLADRFTIDPPTLVHYDLEARKIVRTIPWPDNEPRERAELLFSPDGKLLYLFGEDVTILETAGFTVVEKWEMSRPPEDGLGRLEFGSLDMPVGDPGVFTGLFTMQDPVQKRRMLGVGRIELASRTVDFFTVGPASPLRSFAIAPDRTRGYGLRQEIGLYELWTFDLSGRTLLSRREFAGRPRMDVAVSSSGAVVYIYTAGHTIDLYEAATARYLRTIELPGDMNTQMYVLPRP